MGNLSSLSNVSERNTLKREAFLAYQKRDFKKAATLYQHLADATFIIDPAVRMNLANAYFSINDTINAKKNYQKLIRLHDVDISSAALTQLGLMTTQNGDSTTALSLFKEALEKKPDNNVARFDYELLKKQLPKTKLPPPPKQQQKKQLASSLATTALEQSEIKKQNLKTIQPENVSKEKALQILDAMKNNEIQYIQQKKKSNSGKKQEKDW